MSVDNAIEDRREIDSQEALDVLLDHYETQLLRDDEFLAKEWRKNFGKSLFQQILGRKSLLKQIEFNKENNSIQFTVDDIKACEKAIPMALKYSNPI